MIPLLDRNRNAMPKDSPKAKSRAKPKVSPGQLASVKIEQFKEFLRTKSLEAAIPLDFKRNGVQLVKYERIGGMTNKNYKVLMGTEVLVLRLPGRGTGRFINRSHERTNQAAAARAGFTPPALYFNQFTGVKVSSFLQEASIFSPETACLPENYLQLAKVLRIFHDSQIGRASCRVTV